LFLFKRKSLKGLSRLRAKTSVSTAR